MGLTPDALVELEDILGELEVFPGVLSRWMSQNIHDAGPLAPVVNDASHTIRLVVRHVEMCVSHLTE